MVFQVDGTDKRTGERKSLTIEAQAAADAKLMATRLGMVVDAVTVVGGVPEPVVEVETPSGDAPMAPVHHTSTTYAASTHASSGRMASSGHAAESFTRPGMVMPFKKRSNAQTGVDWLVYAVFIVLAVVLVVSGLNDLSFAPAYIPDFDGDSSQASVTAVSMLRTEVNTHHTIGMLKILGAILVALLIEAIRLRTLLRDWLAVPRE